VGRYSLGLDGVTPRGKETSKIRELKIDGAFSGFVRHVNQLLAYSPGALPNNGWELLTLNRKYDFINFAKCPKVSNTIQIRSIWL
jgi:hypothetical protein